MPVAAVASWRTKPRAVGGDWRCFRQVSPEFPPLFHSAGALAPDQESGRWHRRGEGFAQYFSLTAFGSWAEYARYANIRSPTQAAEQRRNLWMAFVRETNIADLRGFAELEACGLDPAMAVARDRKPCQKLADELREAGYHGLLAPSAALGDTVNLTLFGERYEYTEVDPGDSWSTPDPSVWITCELLAESSPVPTDVVGRTVFASDRHPGLP
jgi:hypothetical protein